MSKQKNNSATPSDAESTSGPQRLQRVMAAAGIGSRRECEIIIQEGRVEVDGKIVATLGVKVDPQAQKVFVDGQRLVAERLQYFMLNKPPGVISTNNDPSGRARVIDLIKTEQRVYNVGRLDQSSEGLILVTNDGELANRLTHPRYGIEKKYHVQVVGTPTAEQLRSLEEGVYFAEGKAKATSAKFLRTSKNSSWIEIVLAEGRNREIRRMLASVGHKVRTLKRVAIGPLKMGDLPVGAHRALTLQELKLLQRAADGLAKPRTRASKKKLAAKTFSKIDERTRVPSGAPDNTGNQGKKSSRPSLKRSSAKRPAKFTSNKIAISRSSEKARVGSTTDEKIPNPRTPFDKTPFDKPAELNSGTNKPLDHKSASGKQLGRKTEFSRSTPRKSKSGKSASSDSRFDDRSSENKKTKSRSSNKPRGAGFNRSKNQRKK